MTLSDEQLDQLAGRCLMVDVAGPALGPEEAARLRKMRVRAICLFRRNVPDAASTRRLVAGLKAALGDDILVGLDQEGGGVMRTLFLPQAPAAMALAAAGDEALARQVGGAVARGLKSLGINWNFAPVLDLNNNPANPVIGERSFGAEPARAAALARAWMEGHLAEGVACCVKHFPGHGDTHTDSHLDLPVVDKPQAELRDYELAPFKALAPHAPALMSAHIRFPSLDAEWPATLSPGILTGLLRHELGFQGVAITDALNMKAIRERWGQAAGSVQTLKAGADLALVLQFPDEMEASFNALRAALRGGELAPERLQEAAARVDALTRRYPSLGDDDYAAEQRAADEALFADAWVRALTAHGEVPLLRAGQRLRLVVQDQAPSDGVSEAGLSADRLIAALSRRHALEVVRFKNRAMLDWATLPRDGAFTVLASTSRERYLRREQHSWKPDLHLALWNPYAAADIAAPALISYGFADAALDAISRCLAGEIDAAGRLPVPLGGPHQEQ
ncbi:beta-N-acetylhexosaminidase [Chromobacterium subtsugae]|uniref:Beta-N-acetylhexosaminidase n=1 Tax=Chromobacterium subtsugae TaxID=251747 RepID=A0ABS7F9P9_9NEIS|nr:MULTISPECIES: beta-N-acetylhexosaminidase [Chromobacterium]KUM04341.1 beta-N-acetylhexosaminidase [Chromobacterium subtsugae]KZE86168.1 beta-N-acetylhexosaminidase [Chromobacterium sp. F49]MBW7568817.1 beta-N-acetylhexosaminidase [Chromobacterium subtsugae]MBW8286018.1 beta-N-acetylhexosaminidase [Chromobacterium subtsugae]WSE91925.1 beta-N-acetylhexosaminidase [Chromobacterium subtsugae]